MYDYDYNKKIGDKISVELSSISLEQIDAMSILNELDGASQEYIDEVLKENIGSLDELKEKINITSQK